MVDDNLEHELRVRKELSEMGDEIAPIIDDAINEGSLIKRRGFIIFIIDYSTGVTHMGTSCNVNDVQELLRFWVAEEDKKKLN